MPRTSLDFVFDELRWAVAIKQADWYLDFIRQAESVQKQADKPTLDKFRRDSRHFFERELLAGNVALAQNGPNLDIEREAVDTIVIHHTSHKPGYRISYMNATQMLSIYAPYFINPTVPGEESLKSQALWSGHSFKNGQPNFIGYHWLLRMNGKAERILNDSELGWHAGHWQINRRSVGICLDNDYETANPNETMLKNLAKLISKHYPQVKAQNIIGHCEARQGTICPGSNFLAGWKQKLLEYL